MEPQYIDPTPKSRRRVLLTFAIASLVGLGAIQGVQMLLGHIKMLPICDQISAFRWLWSTVLVALAAGGVWSAWLARQILRANQCPLPGTSVFRRTTIHRGAARWRAYVALGLGVYMIAGSVWAWYVGEKVAQRADTTQRCSMN